MSESIVLNIRDADLKEEIITAFEVNYGLGGTLSGEDLVKSVLRNFILNVLNENRARLAANSIDREQSLE